MNSDSYFRIGYTHDICEDFAIAGGQNDKSFAILSDGCSGSPRTDFGARFLTRALEQILNNETLTKEDIPSLGIKIAKTISTTAQLDDTCLDATLGYVLADKTHFKTFLAGDGAIAALKKDGNKWAAIVNYPMGAPPYLSYSLDEKRLQYFLTQTEGCAFNINIHRWTDTTEVVQESWEGKGMNPHLFNFPKDEYELIIIMSDGICSFQKPTNNETTKCFEIVDPIYIINKLLAVKSFKGEFIKRRCKRIIKNLCIKNGWKHLDDISIIALHNKTIK